MDEVYLKNSALQMLLSVQNEIDRLVALRNDAERRLMVRSYSEIILLDQNGNPIQARAEADGTLRGQVVLWDFTGVQQIRAAGEPATGQAQVSLWGHDGIQLRRLAIQDLGLGAGAPGPAVVTQEGFDGAAWRGWRYEPSGEPTISLHGQDEAANVDALRTDPNRILWKRDYPGYVQVDPVEIPVAEGILWNPGATAAQLFEVSFLVINNDAGAAAVTVSVGVDIAAGGALASPEWWMFNEIVPYPGTSGWRGPFVIAGDDDVRGVASAANDASIHFRVKRVDVGA
jgi:hypothetical protein